MYLGKYKKHVKAVAIIGASLIFCGSVAAYADVAAPWAGPGPYSHEEREIDTAMPDVSFGIEENGEMRMYFHFNASCQYEYVVRRGDSDEMAAYGKGIGIKGSTEQDIFSYESPEEGVTAHYVLDMDATFEHRTRFGNKLSSNWMHKHVYVKKVNGEDKVSILPLGSE